MTPTLGTYMLVAVLHSTAWIMRVFLCEVALALSCHAARTRCVLTSLHAAAVMPQGAHAAQVTGRLHMRSHRRPQRALLRQATRRSSPAPALLRLPRLRCMLSSRCSTSVFILLLSAFYWAQPPLSADIVLAQLDHGVCNKSAPTQPASPSSSASKLD